MSIFKREIYKAIAIFWNIENVRIAWEAAAKGALVSGVLTFIGGFLMGREGLTLGAIIGGAVSYVLSGVFPSFGYVFRNDLTARQQRQFVRHVRNAVDPVGIIAIVFRLIAQKVVQHARSYRTRAVVSRE